MGKMVKCATCKGKGNVDVGTLTIKKRKCPVCGGSGKVEQK